MMPPRRRAKMVAVSVPIPDLYRQRETRFGGVMRDAEGRSLRMANLRAALFVGAALLAVVGLWKVPWLIVVAGALLVGFVVAVRRHGVVERELEHARVLHRLQQEALARLERRLGDVPETPVAPTPPPEAADLDLVGEGSLLHLVSTAGTGHGRRCLASWLLRPASPDIIRQRQDAVVELAPQLDLRHDLAVLARSIGDGSDDLEPFLVWAEGRAWLLDRPWLTWLARGMTVITPVVIAACASGLLPAPLWSWAWVLPVAVNLILTRIAHHPIKHTFASATPGERVFRHYAELLAMVSGASFTTPTLGQLRDQLATAEPGAHGRMRRLDRLASLANLRTSPMAWLPIQAVTLWDLHVLRALERWQADAGAAVRGWFEAIGELEALCALSALAHDHPDWTMPRVDADENPELDARDLGHPLLPPADCVRNDVHLGPTGTVLLVTGSNMSGKSTLLRAIGSNVVLAQAGGPVCAAAMSLPPVVLGTSFRIQDSLTDGVSYFMAELRRLKEVVDRAEQITASGDAVLLFLLDEILLGTNVAERQIAVQQVLGQLLEQHTLGAVATHDLSLAEADGLADRCQPIHFTETFFRDEDGPQMTFDYRARPGISPTTNALKLLELVGLDRRRDG